MSPPPPEEAATLRLRTGTFPATNAVIAFVGVAAAIGVLVVAGGVVSTSTGSDRVWGVVGGVLDLGFLLVMAVSLMASVSALRPVCVRPGPDGWRSGQVSLPQFSVRHGFTRASVALRDVRTIDLAYRSQPRNSRWQLVLHAGESVLACDSISSTKPDREVRRSPAYAAVQRVKDCVIAAQT